MGSRIKIVQVIFLFLGILTIALGFFVITPQIVQSVIYHSSPGKVLAELGITLVREFRIKIIFLGAMLFLLSIILGYSLPLTNSIIRKIESEHLVEKSVSSTGRLLDLIYRVGTNETFLWCFLILIFISLLLPNVFLSSSGGFHHESIDVQPAKNLARHGAYATLTTRGFDDYTYKITTGPGILVPIALVFKLFGINVYYSRAVYLAFSIATLIIFYHMTRDLYGKKVALLAVFISIPMILSIDEAVTEYISGLFYFLVGALFWFKSIESKKNIPLVLSGLFWGLSFQTKWLFLFAIFAVIVTCIILSLSKKGLESRYYLIPSSMVCLVTMAWFIFRIFNVGLRLELWHLLAFWGEHGHRAVGTGTEKGIFSSIYAIARPLASLSQINLWGNLQLLLTIAAIFYVIILIGKSKMTDYKSLFFMSFTIIWFIWWLLFNYDLPGLHLRIILVMSQLFIAKFLYDIWEYSSAYKDGLVNLLKNKETQKATMFYLLRIAIIYIVFGNVLLPLFKDAKFLYNFNLRVTKAEKEMMTYIRNNTEKNAVFSGWAWSMPWYVDLDSAGDHINKDRSTYPPEQRESVPEYFIVSPEWPVVSVSDEWPNVVVVNNWSIKENEIRKKFLEENCTLVKTFGGDEYKWLLYKVNNDKLSLSPRN